MFKLDEFAKVINKNNENLIKVKKSFPYIKSNENGEEQYSVQYYGEKFKICKVKGRTSTYYQLVKEIENKAGKTIKLQFSLNEDQVAYIDYHYDDLLKNMYANQAIERMFKTRVVYGNNNNGLYVCVIVLIADRIRLSFFLRPLQLDIFKDAMSNIDTAFNIILEEKLDVEDIDDQEDLLI